MSQIRAIGTSALRDAEDGPEFCDRVRKELKLSIEVISANEEARLAFLSVARAFDISGRKVAVADIGGGSTEIVLASSGLVDQVYETKLGAVRVAEECGVTGRSTEKQVAKLRDFVDRKLEEGSRQAAVRARHAVRHGRHVHGAGVDHHGPARACGPTDVGLPRDARADSAPRGRPREMSLESGARWPASRRSGPTSSWPGLAIIERIMRQLHVNVVQVHTRGVRDGLLLTMVTASRRRRPAVPAEERRAAVEEFAKNCGVDLPHARQVARIAGSLWQQLAAPLGLKAEDRELIESAALMANVGYLINFEGHHKHSYHLIVNSELPGFERRQLQILANVARYHRGSGPKKKHEDFAELSLEDQARVRALAAILRLALALDRTHQQHVGEVRARVRDDGVRIVIQSQGDAEVDLWAAERKVELFEKVFGRKVRFFARGANRPRVRRRVRSSSKRSR